MDNGLERCYSLRDLPELANADFLRVFPHRGEPAKWGIFKYCWADHVCLTAYNETEFLLYHDCDTFEEYIEEFGLDMESPIEDLADNDQVIRKFIEDPNRTQIWELNIDYQTNWVDANWYHGAEITSIDDVYRVLREGLSILCHDYRSYELGSYELDACKKDLWEVENYRESAEMYESYFSKDELAERIKQRINELEKLLRKED